MSRQINQPINQVRLTNVAVVRVNLNGKRFEIACYRNKVVNYRQGLEQDLSEVLQTERIFSNVSKGKFAKAFDLQLAFGTKDEQEIAKIILAKGQLQVSDKERNQQLDKTNAQIAEWVGKHCVNPETNRPYTISQIRHAMQQANFAVHPTKPLKRQYLDCVKMLQSIIPIQRAKMELALSVPEPERTAVEKILNDNEAKWSVVANDTDAVPLQIKALVDPSLYRVLNDVLEPVEGGKIEILVQVVTQAGDVDIELDVSQLTINPKSAGSTTHREKEGDDEDDDSDDDGDEIDNNGNKNSKNNNHRGHDDDDDDDESTDGGSNLWAKSKKQRKKQQKMKSRAAKMESSAAQKVEEPTAPTTSLPVSASDSNTSGRKSCNTCGGSFGSAAEYRTHFKTDWHRYNQKLKLKGLDPMSEEEFKLFDTSMFEGGL